MKLKERIRGELMKQQEIEGHTPDTGLLLRVIDIVQRKSDWDVLARCRIHKYGTQSYEGWRFYYPTELLRDLQKMFTDEG